jgi:hypothetical protein
MNIFDEKLPADPVIDAYKKDVDVGLIRENLRLTANERLQKLQEHMAFSEEIRYAGRRAQRAL